MVTTLNGSAVPRQVNTPQTSGNTVAPPNTGKTLALVGSFPFLEPDVVRTVSSAGALKKILPTSDTLKLLERLVYNCAPQEPQARQQPAFVHLVNALPSTQAVAVLYNSTPTASLDVASNLWGAIGNRTTVTVAAATVVGPASSGKKYTITAPNLPTETYDNVGGNNIITVNYTGSQATTMVMAYDQTTGLRISYTKTAIALGTLTITDISFDGTITVTPSVGPGVGETFTVTVNGVDKATGLVTSEAVTFNNAGGTTPQTTAKAWASVSTIVFAATAGTPTFSIAGYSFDLAPGPSYPTAASFADRIEPAAGYTATVAAVTAAGLDSSLLDTFSSATIASAAKSLTADVNAAVVAMAGSYLVTVTRATGADSAPANATYPLAGGADGSESLGGYQDALAVLEDYDVTHLWMDTDSASYQSAGLDHVTAMWGVGGRSRQLWVGATADETLSALVARVLAFNSPQVNLWFQEFRRLSPAGTLTWYAPKYLALEEAALRCAMAPGEPSTRKRPNVVDFRQNSAIDVQTDQNTLIQSHLCFVAQFTGLGIVNIRPVTTYGVGDNVFYDEPGSVESFNMSVNDVNFAITAAQVIGASNVRYTAADFKQIILRRLNQQVASGTRLIKAFDPTSIEIEVISADLYRGSWDEQPITGINFTDTQPTATFVTASVEG